MPFTLLEAEMIARVSTAVILSGLLNYVLLHIAGR
jgi:hypothetical protein